MQTFLFIQVQPTTATATCDMDTNCRYEGQCDYTDGPPGVCRCTGTGFFQYCEKEWVIAMCFSQ